MRGGVFVMANRASIEVPPGGTAPNQPVHSTACNKTLHIACGAEIAASLTIMKERPDVLSHEAARHVCHKTALQVVALRLRHRLEAHQIRRYALLLSTRPDGKNMSVEAVGGDTITGGMAVVQETAFADLFEAAFLEESMSLDLVAEASVASTSINLLSLGPKTSAGCELTRRFSIGPDVSELHALEPVGLPDEAWQRLYERIAQQRGPASQMLKDGNEDLLQIFMSGAPEPGSVQQVASCLGQSEDNVASSKLRGAATSSAGALAC